MQHIISNTSCSNISQPNLSHANTDIAKKIDIINTKLNDINTSTTDLNIFKQFWNEHKDNIASLSINSDNGNKLLKSVMNTINSIKDNIVSGDNNDENHRELNVHMVEIRQIAQQQEIEKRTKDRIEKEISRSSEKMKTEISRVSDLVTKEVSRNTDKVKKEVDRFFRKI